MPINLTDPNAKYEVTEQGGDATMPPVTTQIAENEQPTPEAQAAQDERAKLQAQLNPIETSEDTMRCWLGWIEEAENRNKTWEEWWDALIEEYMPMVVKSGSPESVKTNAHF